MHIVFGHHRQIEVDHHWQLVDIQAAGGNVGGDHHRGLAGLEIGQRPGPRALALVAVDHRAMQAMLFQEPGQLVATVLGAAENQGLAAAVAAEQLQQQLALARDIHRMHAVADRGGDAVALRHLDLGRVTHELAGQLADGIGERGREQQRLPVLARQDRQDLAHRRQEAHVQHPVALVQHQHLDVGQVYRLLLHVVDQPAWRGDDEVQATAQRLDLRLDADTPEDGGAARPQMAAVIAQALVHLRGQLTGRGQDQRTRTALARGGTVAVNHQPLQHRQHESGGLAGTGLGASEQVAAGQHQGNGLRLDRRGRGIALRSHRAQQFGRQPEGVERHGVVPCMSGNRQAPGADRQRSRGKPRCGSMIGDRRQLKLRSGCGGEKPDRQTDGSGKH